MRESKAPAPSPPTAAKPLSPWAGPKGTALAAWLAVILMMLGLGIQIYQVAEGSGPPQVQIKIVQLGGTTNINNP